MAQELFSYEPEEGLSIWFDYDDLTDEVTLEYRPIGIDDVLELNKKLANDPDVTRAGFKQEFWHYASIPNFLIMKWVIEEGWDVYDDNNWPKLSQKLNDPEYQYLKTTHKRHVFKG